MRARRFEDAIDRLQRLIPSFPDEPELQEDLNRARGARDEAARKDAYAQARGELDDLIKARRFDDAVRQAQQLVAAYPDESELQDDLSRARDARDHAARKDAFAQARQELDALMRSRRFDEAIAEAEELIAANPDESELQDDLQRARNSREQAARKDAYAKGLREFEDFMRARRFDDAIAKAQQLIATFPNESQLQDDLRRATDARDQLNRKAAYIKRRAEFEALMRKRSFAEAIAKAEELIAAFPDESELRDDLRRARDARQQAARKDAYSQGRADFETLLRNRRFDEAIAKAQQLIAAFPGDPDLEDDLRRARDARQQAARKDAYSQGRADFDVLLRSRRFDEAIAKAQQLIAAFPGEPELEDDLRRSRDARDQAARNEAYAQGRKEFETLLRNRAFAEAIAKAQQLIAAFPDEPELQECMRRVREAREQDAAARERRRSTRCCAAAASTRLSPRDASSQPPIPGNRSGRKPCAAQPKRATRPPGRKRVHKAARRSTPF